MSLCFQEKGPKLKYLWQYYVALKNVRIWIHETSLLENFLYLLNIFWSFISFWSFVSFWSFELYCSESYLPIYIMPIQTRISTMEVKHIIADMIKEVKNVSVTSLDISIKLIETRGEFYTTLASLEQIT